MGTPANTEAVRRWCRCKSRQSPPPEMTKAVRKKAQFTSSLGSQSFASTNRRESMSARTSFLSRLIGIYCILVAIAMALNKQATVQMVLALVNNGPLMFVFGLILVAVGLAMILSHNIWTGGALPFIVTLVGWLTLVKGLLFLFLPPPAAAGIFIWGNAYEQYFYLDAAAAFILGAYLTYCGFRFR
jgi:hypothetical protein